MIELEEEMLAAADDLRFEEAARIRDELKELKARPRRNPRLAGELASVRSKHEDRNRGRGAHRWELRDAVRQRRS